MLGGETPDPDFVGIDAAILRPDLVPGVPIYLTGAPYPGGKALNPAAFTAPPTRLYLGVLPVVTREGDLGRNSLRSFGAVSAII
ncbi:MAG: hypothetical protein ACR2NN_05415 [Bryobacteraceae bacterium]